MQDSYYNYGLEHDGYMIFPLEFDYLNFNCGAIRLLLNAQKDEAKDIYVLMH